MTSAPDTPAGRIAEYHRLFSQALLGRERTAAGIRFRFAGRPGIGDWVRDLARREQACCAFFRFSVTATGGEVWWEASVTDDETSRQVLAEFFRLPETAAAGAGPVRDAFAARGLRFTGGEPG